MNVYLIMHEIYEEGCEQEIDDTVFEVWATREQAVDRIKKIDTSECETLVEELIEHGKLEDSFNGNSRLLRVDSHSYDKFYVVEEQVKGF